MSLLTGGNIQCQWRLPWIHAKRDRQNNLHYRTMGHFMFHVPQSNNVTWSVESSVWSTVAQYTLDGSDGVTMTDQKILERRMKSFRRFCVGVWLREMIFHSQKASVWTVPRMTIRDCLPLYFLLSRFNINQINVCKWELSVAQKYTA